MAIHVVTIAQPELTLNSELPNLQCKVWYVETVYQIAAKSYEWYDDTWTLILLRQTNTLKNAAKYECQMMKRK